MTRLSILIMVVSLSPACTRPTDRYCDQNTPCPTERWPFCDLNGQYAESEGLTNICITQPGGDAGADGPVGTTDGGVVDASPPDAPRCVDAGLCPADTPVCRAGICSACATSTECPLGAPVCAASGRCMACAGEGDCSARPGTTHCGTGGACVECRSSTDCTTDLGRPVCEVGSGECRRCEENSECPSQVCATETGQCVPEGTVLYVNKTATSSGPSCTRALPCRDIGAALVLAGPTRNWVQVAPGQYVEQLRVTSGAVTVAAASAGVVISPDGTDKPVVLVTDSGGLTLFGLTIRGGAGAAGVGVKCLGAAAPFPSVTVDRATITQNFGGGISITDCDFSIRNSIIAANGSTVTVLGGILISQTRQNVNGRLLFNTIAGNAASSTSAAGVTCSTAEAGLSFPNNIVYGNTTSSQVSGTCGFTFSDIGPTGVGGVGNINADPLLTGDYHLMPLSPCRNAAEPAAVLDVDIDGDVRPQGGRSDIGADELR